MKEKVIAYLEKNFSDAVINTWLEQISKEEIISDLIWMIEPMCKTTVIDYPNETGEHIYETIKTHYKQLT